MNHGGSMTEDERYQRALHRVRELKEFYGHLTSYVLVNAGLFLVDVFTGDGWWFYWPLLGWGIAVVAHGISAFGLVDLFGKDWEERKVRELMEKDKG